jgi:hypothetical protein
MFAEKEQSASDGVRFFAGVRERITHPNALKRIVTKPKGKAA